MGFSPCPNPSSTNAHSRSWVLAPAQTPAPPMLDTYDGCKYVGQKDLAAMPWLLWNPRQMSPEVQNRRISGPTKRNICPPKMFLKSLEKFDRPNFEKNRFLHWFQWAWRLTFISQLLKNRKVNIFQTSKLLLWSLSTIYTITSIRSCEYSNLNGWKIIAWTYKQIDLNPQIVNIICFLTDKWTLRRTPKATQIYLRRLTPCWTIHWTCPAFQVSTFNQNSPRVRSFYFLFWTESTVIGVVTLVTERLRRMPRSSK